METFAAYISYARDAVHPQMSDECIDLIAEEYVRLRQIGDSKHTISATTRQLEALIRLSEAHARMRYVIAILNILNFYLFFCG